MAYIYICCIYIYTIAFGNTFTMIVNNFITNINDGASFFYFFAIVMFITALLFLLVVKFFKPKTYLQEEK